MEIVDMHTCKCKIGINLKFGNKHLIMFISSNSCHKNMLLESANILLILYWTSEVFFAFQLLGYKTKGRQRKCGKVCQGETLQDRTFKKECHH